jgi:hypothetical protein
VPRFNIVLLDRPGGKPGGSGSTNRDERHFASLQRAVQRAREMYQSHENSVIGFQVYDAAGKLVHEWKRDGRW